MPKQKQSAVPNVGGYVIALDFRTAKVVVIPLIRTVDSEDLVQEAFECHGLDHSDVEWMVVETLNLEVKI